MSYIVEYTTLSGKRIPITHKIFETAEAAEAHGRKSVAEGNYRDYTVVEAAETKYRVTAKSLDDDSTFKGGLKSKAAADAEAEKLRKAKNKRGGKSFDNVKVVAEGYKVLPSIDREKYQERPGLEGPFQTMAGKVVYYDPKEGSYYDPDTDMYMSYDEFKALDNDYSGMRDERDIPVKEAKGLASINWPDADKWGSEMAKHAENAIRHGMHAYDAYDHVFSMTHERDWMRDHKDELIKMFASYGLATESIKESLTLDYSRYMRSHGKKPRVTGPGLFMFTTKDMGEPAEDDVFQFQGNFADAKRAAAKWAKSKGAYRFYMMENTVNNRPVVKENEEPVKFNGRTFNDYKRFSSKDRANQFLEKNEAYGVIGEKDGYVYVAKNADLGMKDLDEASAKIACIKCDEVSTAKAWEKNRGFCPKCKTSNQGVAESINEATKVEIPKSRYLTLLKMHGPKKVERTPKGEMQYRGAEHVAHNKDTDTSITQTYSHPDHSIATIEKHTHNPTGKVTYYMRKKQTNESVNEDISQDAHHMERDHEVQMARSDLYKTANYAIKLHSILKGISEEQGIEGWMQAKITKAADYLSSVFHALEYDQLERSQSEPMSALESVNETTTAGAVASVPMPMGKMIKRKKK